MLIKFTIRTWVVQTEKEQEAFGVIFRLGAELLIDELTSEALCLSLPMVSSGMRTPSRSRHMYMQSLPLLSLVSPEHPSTLHWRSVPLLPGVHGVCMMTSADMPGHQLLWACLSYSLQHIQQKFFKVYGMWAKVVLNFESWCRLSNFLVGLVLAFILRCKGSRNITISLCFMGLR